MAAVVQIFYAYRIKLLADSYIIPSVVVLVNFVFIHLKWLVLICVVGISPTRRRNLTRCADWEDAFFLQAIRQEDIYSSWCMCSESFLEALANLRILTNFHRSCMEVALFVMC